VANPYDYIVEDSLLAIFPPAPPDVFNVGWKSTKWYVVLKGFRPGIYYDFW
jgi:hypothetical protein